MKRYQIFWVLFLLTLLFISPVMGADDHPYQGQTDEHSIAPVNPEFATFIAEARASRLDFNLDTTKTLGLIPPTVDLSFSRGTKISDFSISEYSSSSKNYFESSSLSNVDSASSGILSSSNTLPGSFDLKSQGKMTAVKNQGQCGSCWAFSTYASLESGLLPSEILDFSENNMRNSHGYDISSCFGGNSLMATAYLARWSGALLESSDPYSTTSKSATSVTYPNPAAVKHVQEVLYIPGRSSSFDNDNIKKTLMEKGAVYSSIRWEDSSYRSSTASYYYSGSSQANHAITIVGWDDTYDRSRFPKQPPGNGAFFVKNSWGSSWGETGFFYVSYYDTIIGKDNAFFSAEPSDNYDHIYQYDPLGWIVSFGDNSETEYFANIFTADSVENLAAVSFYTPSANSKYQISVYTGAKNGPVAGSAVSSQSGTISVPGYHTLTLHTPVQLKKGERFSVVVKLTTPGYKYPVAIEYPISGYSSGARAGNGQSYVSSTGTVWTDLNSVYPNTNVCLKAFTTQAFSTSPPTPTPTPTKVVTVTPTPTQTATAQSDTRSPVVSVTSPRSYSSVIPGTSVQVTWSATDNTGVAGIDVLYSKDKGKTWNITALNLAETGSYSLSVPSDASGIFMIRITARDSAGNEGSATRSCIVKSSSLVGTNVLGITPLAVTAIPLTPTITPLVPMTADDWKPVVSIISPGFSSSVSPGFPIQVTWSASDNKGVTGVGIGISKDNGNTWDIVAGNLAKSGSFSLTVPGDASGIFMIRVSARDSAGNEGSSIRSCMVKSDPP